MTSQPLRRPGILLAAAVASALAVDAIAPRAWASGAPRACAGADISRQADSILAPYEQAQAFSGAILVARDGRTVLRRGVGLVDREWGVPNTPDTKFRLGSITKQFTAAAILQLAEQGRLSIEDPISKYYAEAPASWGKVTLEHLLTHTSGIPSYTTPKFMTEGKRIARTPEEIVRLTQDEPLEFEPGTKFAYDNTGYILLGYVIEKVSGQRYADYLKSHIFGPLGMKDTGYDVNAEILPRRASGYAPGPQGWVNADYIDMSLPFAAGALYSTVDDLLTWEQALFGGKVIGPASLKLMTTDWGFHYGFGLFLARPGGHEEIYHGGGIDGFATALQRYPADGVTSIVLSNFQAAQSNWLAMQLATTCMGEPGPAIVRLSPAEIDRDVGDYRQGAGLSFHVVREGDHLLATTPGQPPTRLYPIGHDRFVAKIVPGQASFEPGGQGKAVAMVLHGDGPDLRLDRTPGP